MSLSGGTTLISKATKIVGDVHFSGSLEIEGEVEGNIIADGKGDAKVNVREKGRVTGDISAPLIMVNGHVRGNVHSDKHIELAAKAVVEGNVHYHMIEMVKGSQVNGSLVYGAADKAKEVPKAAPKPAPSAAIVD
jgi:cytoskeletal protein CcmA (bactofilin family)